MYVNGKKFTKGDFYNVPESLADPTYGPLVIWIVLDQLLRKA